MAPYRTHLPSTVNTLTFFSQYDAPTQSRTTSTPRPVTYTNIYINQSTPRPVTYTNIYINQSTPRPVTYTNIYINQSTPRPITYTNIYSRTPLLRPPLGLAICGRNRGVAVIQALEHVATCVYVAKYTCTCNIYMYVILYLKLGKIPSEILSQL